MKPVAFYILGLVTLPALALIAAFTGLLPSNATSNPPDWEVAIAGKALDTSLERRASGLKSPAGASASSTNPHTLFDNDCSACHGSKEKPSSITLYPRAPQFFQEGGTDLAPSETYTAIHDGIRYSGMPAWGGRIPDPDIWALAKYLSADGKGEKGGKRGEGGPDKS